MTEISDETAGEARSEPATDLIAGEQIGKYELRRIVGAGGMGVVWAAYDPDLDREIAIKLLRGSDRGPTSRTRLLREARAMARLKHPNVLTAYEVGTESNRDFVVMELVDGGSLDRWLATRPPHRDVLAALVAAGRGLAAAHAAGLIHRDFKPHNVLRSADGRVLVTDFGLAREGPVTDEDAALARPGDGTAPPFGGAAGRAQGPTVVSSPLTTTGVLIGTPAYMSPEQLAGAPSDATTDQYAYCVTAWEALAGERPFRSTTVDELRAATARGAAGIAAKLSSYHRATLERGLDPDPAKRWPDMDTLLAALEHDPVAARRRRIRMIASVLSLAVFAGLAVFGLTRSTRDTRCEGMDSRLAGVWDPPRAEAVLAAFVATKRPYATDTYTRVAGQLDRYAHDWVGIRVATCEATRRRGDQSESLLDLRMACLDKHLVTLGALVDVFAKEPSASVLDRAVEATAKLPALHACAELTAAQATVPLPADPHAVAEIAAVRRAIAEANALDDTGQYASGQLVVTKAVTQAEHLSYAPVLAEALAQQGRLESNLGDAKASKATYDQALLSAAEAHDDALVALIWADLVFVVGFDLAHSDDALLLRPAAEAALRRGGTPEAAARLENSLGGVYQARHDYEQARQHYERALPLFEKLFGTDDPWVAASLNNLGATLKGLHHDDDARGYLERSVALYEKVLGPEHPRVADALTNLANVLRVQGRFDDARRDLERALAIDTKALGPDHPNLARRYTGLGNLDAAQHHYDDAQRNYERALAIMTLASDQPSIATLEMNLGGNAYSQNKFDEARRHYEREIAILDKATDSNHPRLRTELTLLGESLLSLKRSREAVAVAERAVQLGADPDVPAKDLAASRYLLARALWSVGEHGRALVEARQARDTFAALGAPSKDDLADVVTWLRDRN